MKNNYEHASKLQIRRLSKVSAKTREMIWEKIKAYYETLSYPFRVKDVQKYLKSKFNTEHPVHLIR